MADIVYDFKAALDTLKNAHSDMVELITKWAAMIGANPQMVTFNMSDGPRSVPNIQKIIDDVGEGTLPQNPVFETVRVRPNGPAPGNALFENGRAIFSGPGRAYDDQSQYSARAIYSVDGMETATCVINSDDVVRITQWPPPRYIFIDARTEQEYDARILLAPNPSLGIWGTGGAPLMRSTDFFVTIPGTRRASLVLGTDGTRGGKTFMLVGDGPDDANRTTFHICADFAYQVGRLVGNGSCVKMTPYIS